MNNLLLPGEIKYMNFIFKQNSNVELTKTKINLFIIRSINKNHTEIKNILKFQLIYINIELKYELWIKF